jgi:curved DNA-binding protein
MYHWSHRRERRRESSEARLGVFLDHRIGYNAEVPTTFQDYYKILGVPKKATQKEIKAAFRKLARKHHPDLNQNDPAAETRFKEINEANEVLSDPAKRRLYDEVGPRWREYEAWDKAGRPGPSPFGGGQAGPAGGFGSFGGGDGVEYRTVSPEELEGLFGDADPFSDFFHSMFGRGAGGAGGAQGTRARRRSVPRRGEDVEGTTEITLEEAYSGTTRTIEMSGAGSTRRVEITIPRGVADGARVRAAGQGGSGSAGAQAGDLYVRVRIRPHPRFVREGDDLRTTVEVPLDVALLGGEVPVRTLRGTTAHLRVAPGIQNGAKLRMRGLGMPKLRGSGHGDLIAEITVRLPEKLSDAARALAEQLRAERLGS